MTRDDIHRGYATTPDGVRVAYQSCGEGPAFVCCHAMANDHTMWNGHRSNFSESHRFITFDQRGAGDSDHPPFVEGPESAYTVDLFGDDLRAVLDELGIERATVLGFSMGVVAALSFATRWPERVDRLVLVSAMASRLPEPIIERARLVEDFLDAKGINETYDFYFSGSLFEGLADTAEFRRNIVLLKSKATAHGFKGCFRVTIDRPSMVGRLGVIDAPTLILVGERDAHYLAEAEMLEAKIPNAIRLVVPNVGHPIALQDPATFETHVLDFIS